MPKLYVLEYVVEGRGEFPLDMLRYDQSTFASELDSLTAGRWGEPRAVRLRRYTGDRLWTPGQKRWESFGWDCSPVDARKYADTF